MGRIALAVLVWVVFVGGLAVYMDRRTEVIPGGGFPPRPFVPFLEHCRLEATPTFYPVPDSFAVRTPDRDQGHALIVRQGRRVLMTRTETPGPGIPLTQELAGLEQGLNEFYLEAYPPLNLAGTSYGVRLRLACDDGTRVEQTFWAESGRTVTGTMLVNLDPHAPSAHP